MKHSLVVILVLITVSACFSQKEGEIIKKVRAALLKTADLAETPPPVTGIAKMKMSNVVVDGVMFYRKPNIRMELTIMGMKMIMMQNDTVRWTYDPMKNAHTIVKMTKEQTDTEFKKSMKLDFTATELLNYKSHGAKIKNVGVKKIDSVEVYNLQVTLADNTLIDFLINTRTNLPYKITMGDEYAYYSRYQRDGDFIYPWYMMGQWNGSLIEFQYTDVKLDAALSPDLFKVPQEARDAIKKQEARLETMLARADSLYRTGQYPRRSMSSQRLLMSTAAFTAPTMAADLANSRRKDIMRPSPILI
ncbi:MAG TPA: hypothetical protein VF473_01385 [Cyclobacteriaceae bacterium]